MVHFLKLILQSVGLINNDIKTQTGFKNTGNIRYRYSKDTDTRGDICIVQTCHVSLTIVFRYREIGGRLCMVPNVEKFFVPALS
jgi:hypothetical protein